MYILLLCGSIYAFSQSYKKKNYQIYAVYIQNANNTQ